jgi:hypothetical protein
MPTALVHGLLGRKSHLSDVAATPTVVHNMDFFGLNQLPHSDIFCSAAREEHLYGTHNMPCGFAKGNENEELKIACYPSSGGIVLPCRLSLCRSASAYPLVGRVGGWNQRIDVTNRTDHHGWR